MKIFETINETVHNSSEAIYGMFNATNSQAQITSHTVTLAQSVGYFEDYLQASMESSDAIIETLSCLIDEQDVHEYAYGGVLSQAITPTFELAIANSKEITEEQAIIIRDSISRFTQYGVSVTDANGQLFNFILYTGNAIKIMPGDRYWFQPIVCQLGGSDIDNQFLNAIIFCVKDTRDDSMKYYVKRSFLSVSALYDAAGDVPLTEFEISQSIWNEFLRSKIQWLIDHNSYGGASVLFTSNDSSDDVRTRKMRLLLWAYEIINNLDDYDDEQIPGLIAFNLLGITGWSGNISDLFSEIWYTRYTFTKNIYCSTMSKVLQDLSYNSTELSLYSEMCREYISDDVSIEKITAWANNTIGSVKNCCSSALSIITNNILRYGKMGVIGTIKGYAENLNGLIAGDDDSLEFMDNSQFATTTLMAGVLTVVSNVASTAIAAISLAIGGVLGVVGVVFSAGWSLLSKGINAVHDQAYVEINPESEIACLPYAVFQCTLKSNSGDTPFTERNGELLSLINNKGRIAVHVPGGYIFLWKTGSSDDIRMEFHPGLDTTHFYGINNITNPTSHGTGSNHLYYSTAGVNCPCQAYYQINYVNDQATHITPKDIMNLYESDISTSVVFSEWLNTIGQTKTSSEITNEVYLRALSSLWYFANWMTLSCMSTSSSNENSYVYIVGINWILGDNVYDIGFPTVGLLYYLISILIPDWTQSHTAKFDMLYGYLRDTCMKGSDTRVSWNNDEYSNLFGFPTSVHKCNYDDTLKVLSITGDAINVCTREEFLYRITHTLNSTQTNSYSSVDAFVLAVPNITNWYIHVPKYSESSLILGWIALGILSVTAMAVIGITGFALKKSLNKKRFSLNAACEKAWYVYTDEASTPAQKEAAYKAYNTARIKNNLFCSIFGGTKFSKSGIYDEIGDGGDAITGSLSDTEQLSSENENLTVTNEIRRLISPISED